MSYSANATQYRDEVIAGFELSQSLLRNTVTTEFVREGNSAVFLVEDTSDKEAVTRGLNGVIPSRNDNATQYTATLEEWHDKVRQTKFNIFKSQGSDKRRANMQAGTIKVMNRKTDSLILAALSASTTTATMASGATLFGIANVLTLLGNNEVNVEEEDNMFAAVSPAFFGYLMQTKEFASADYVEMKTLQGQPFRMRRWAGFNWIMHPRVSGVGTASEICYFYHRNAIGHAVDTDNMDVDADYNREDSYSWARCSAFMGSKLLQNGGVVKVTHDGSALSA